MHALALAYHLTSKHHTAIIYDIAFCSLVPKVLCGRRKKVSSTNFWDLREVPLINAYYFNVLKNYSQFQFTG